MTIVQQVVGDRTYYVLQNEEGVPLAQGRLELVQVMRECYELGDTFEQITDRLTFYRVIGTRSRSKPLPHTGDAT
jgi:hypothetical protein